MTMFKPELGHDRFT